MKAAAAFGVLILLAACGGDGDPVGIAGDGSIRGTVTDGTGAAVANAAVELTGNAQAARTASSGADGVYTFADVPPGSYTLAVTPPAGFSVGSATPASVTVASGTQANASAFVLDRVILNGLIRGTVVDFDAGAVADAAVALSGNGQTPRGTLSGADGVYTFTDLPPGAYTLAVTPPTGFVVRGASTFSVTVPNGGQANASRFALTHDSCVVARPDFGGPATAADRALFAYDADAPLDLQQTVVATVNGVRSSTISFTSPDGGPVPGILIEPIGRTGLRPGIVIMHPSGFPASGLVPYATLLAQHGAVVIAIDAPYFRRGGPGLLLTAQDRTEQIQLIKDLQRAVDVLIAHPDVDDERIGFEGYSYGGIIGAQFVGIERRLQAAVLAAAMGGQVTGATTPANQGMLANLTCAARNAWLGAMVPVEPIRFIRDAAPTALLFQIGQFDSAVLPADAQALYEAASQPKEVLHYPTGHGLNPQALYDRHYWMHQQLGIDPPAPLP